MCGGGGGGGERGGEYIQASTITNILIGIHKDIRESIVVKLFISIN